MMKSRETPRAQTQQTSLPKLKYGYRSIQPRILEALNGTKKAAIRTILSALALTACDEGTAAINVTTADAGIFETSRNIGEINIGKTEDAYTPETRNPRDTQSPRDTSMDTAETRIVAIEDANTQDTQDTQEPIDIPNDTANNTTNETEITDVNDATNNTIDVTNTTDTSDTTPPIDIAENCSSTDDLKINQKAINVIGQYINGAVSYTNGSANNGSDKTNDIGLFSPQAIAIDTKNHRLFLADTANNRVKVHLLTKENLLEDYIADYVLGQPDFTSSSQAVSAIGLAAPAALLFDSEKNLLYVGDYGNKRVIIYDLANIKNGQPAKYVLGQPDFTSSSGATTQKGLKGPRGLAYDSTNGRLFVSDAQGNHRVMVFNTADGITDGENAANVLGQTDFTSSVYATSQSRLSSPYNLAYDGTNGRLFVADAGNYRIMVFNTADGITDGENAANVFGQTSFTANTMATTQNGMSYAYGVAYDSVNYRLFVGDTPNNRVMVYDTASITDGEAAVNVLGQALFTTSTAATSQTGLSAPYGITYESGNSYVYVGDSTNNRVMVFDAKTIKCKAKN